MKRSREALLAGAGGAAIAGAFGSLFGLTAPAASVGAINGALAGWKRIYNWRSPKGQLAFVTDSSWALLTTSAATAVHGISALRRDHTYSAELSERQNRHVYGKGLQLRRGFLTTYGNTVCGVGEVIDERRKRLVTDHEDVHVWQTRWFGPLFPLLYGSWMAGGAVAGAIGWLFGVRQAPFTRTVETCAYYLNPFEWWAYSRDDHWPPSGKVEHLGPRRPAVRSFVSRRSCGPVEGSG